MRDSTRPSSESPGSFRPGVQVARTFDARVQVTVPLRHWLYLPPGYEANGDAWPLLLFLHGAGERGGDLERVKAHGPPMRIARGDSLPFIVVSPQCCDGRFGWWDPEALAALLDDIAASYRVDLDRVYVTGLSMGGFGAWALAIAYPDRFAAIAPICGGGDPTRVCALKHVPVWTFHGDADPVVPIERSQVLVDALRACGGNVRFTVYPGTGHDSWTATYENDELYRWLLSHRRRG